MNDERELELRWMLAELQRSYHEAAKPIVDELVDIEAKKPPRPMIIPLPSGDVPAQVTQLIRDVDRRFKEYFEPITQRSSYSKS